MQFILLFLLAVTGPTELDSDLEKYRALVAQAASATEQTSRTADIQRLASSLSDNIRIIADPVFQDTYFLQAYRGKKGIWHQAFSSNSFVPGFNNHVNDAPFIFNVPVTGKFLEKDLFVDADGRLRKSEKFIIPSLNVELGKDYFFISDDGVVLLNLWLYGKEQNVLTAQIGPIKPKYFRGDQCNIGKGYYKPIKSFGETLLVEYRPWTMDGEWCPIGALFEVTTKDFLEKISRVRNEGLQWDHLPTLLESTEQVAIRLANTLYFHRKELAEIQAAGRAEVDAAIRLQEMKKFIDTQMATGATQP